MARKNNMNVLLVYPQFFETSFWKISNALGFIGKKGFAIIVRGNEHVIDTKNSVILLWRAAECGLYLTCKVD